MDYLGKKKVCLGLQFWETKGMDGTGFCKARARGRVQLELGGRHRASVEGRSSWCENRNVQSKKSILPLSGQLAFLRPPPLHTVGLGTKAPQEPGAEEQAFTLPLLTMLRSPSLRRAERTMSNAAVAAIPTRLASIPLLDAAWPPLAGLLPLQPMCWLEDSAAD